MNYNFNNINSMVYETNFKRKILTDEEFLNSVVSKAFSKVDKDNSGEIDFNEFKLLILEVANQGNIDMPPNKDIRTIFNSLDTDGSGEIGIEEFKYLILRIIDMD